MARYGETVVITADLIGGDGQGVMSRSTVYEERMILKAGERRDQQLLFLPDRDTPQALHSRPSDESQLEVVCRRNYPTELADQAEISSPEQTSTPVRQSLPARLTGPLSSSKNLDNESLAIESRLFHECTGQPSPVFVNLEVIDLQIDEEESFQQVNDAGLVLGPVVHNQTWDGIDVDGTRTSSMDDSMSELIAANERQREDRIVRDDTQPNEKLLSVVNILTSLAASLLRQDRELELKLVSYGRTYHILNMALPEFVEDAPLGISKFSSYPPPHQHQHQQNISLEPPTLRRPANSEQSSSKAMSQLPARLTLDRYPKLAVLLDDVKAKIDAVRRKKSKVTEEINLLHKARHEFYETLKSARGAGGDRTNKLSPTTSEASSSSTNIHPPHLKAEHEETHEVLSQSMMELADVELFPRGGKQQEEQEEQAKGPRSCPPKIRHAAPSRFSTGDFLLEMESWEAEDTKLPAFMEQQGLTRIRVPRRAETRSMPASSSIKEAPDEPMAALGSLGKLLARYEETGSYKHDWTGRDPCCSIAVMVWWTVREG
ncbi:hypothetical protein GUITHDRAFT_143414 [Guillardia theta CCMP2712]|uniref:Uncharacterized protein n=1 Tax=Guillardia theta (strain CCMP2712) TaxID=905079 RepID=L1IT26_GUITC|nr:hypothetical protein GUITHDRAFT_143414 [Guillardia theta CCMP2712]EKX39411.1 hypothetical protein GUITHDRAFT_143414 [Guillardia theta CCMP2712]|eukprot:XP_005826391.1 hypothetical protein GUITHDRAFT_143414 [Guillardia theta CCMP2712]